MVKKLYIIGNGFDLHHNLKTSYNSFANYIKNNHSELYNSLEEYVQYPENDRDLWCQFESNLANLDADQILSEYSDRLPNYSSDDFRSGDKYIFPDIMEGHLKLLTYDLIEEFTKFIQGVEYPKNAEQRILEIDADSSFLTFNYTKTLELLYGINKNKILYIHNSAFYGGGEIILGHGISPSNFEDNLPEPPDDIAIEDYEQWYADNGQVEDYSYDEGKDTLWKYFKLSFKPTQDIIKNNQVFFNSLKQIQSIHVLGHSISTVDLPYFKEISKSISNSVIWNISYFSSSEGVRLLETLESIGIDKIKIKFFKLADIQNENRQLKLAL